MLSFTEVFWCWWEVSISTPYSNPVGNPGLPQKRDTIYLYETCLSK